MIAMKGRASSPRTAARSLSSIETYSYTTNSYRAGVDFRLLPKTTISYDQFLSYYKQDNVVTDNPQNSGYQLANGTPVDLGIIWSTAGPVEILPCAAPIATAPNIVNPELQRLSVLQPGGQSEKFHADGAFAVSVKLLQEFSRHRAPLGYSTANNSVPDFNEIVNDSSHGAARVEAQRAARPTPSASP